MSGNSEMSGMNGNSINFDNKKIKKSDFYNNKKIYIGHVDVNRILISKKEQYDKYNSCKYFTVYNYNGRLY